VCVCVCVCVCERARERESERETARLGGLGALVPSGRLDQGPRVAPRQK
jgi:hypothetical protein